MLEKLATLSPMDQLFQLSTTGHPYWVEASKCARPVDIQIITESQELHVEIHKLFPVFSPTVHNCFENAFFLAERLESSGACYVEGFIFHDKLINLHAWISYQGQYFDPTLEHGYALPENRMEQDWREGSHYIGILEMPASKVRSGSGFNGYDPFESMDALIVPPFSRHIWGIPEPYKDQFAINDAVFQLLMMKFSDPHASADPGVITSVRLRNCR